MGNGSTSSNSGNGLSKLDLKNLNWPTVILILITGGGNFLATQQNSSQRQYQVDRAIEQIRDLHGALDETQKRQRLAIEHFETLMASDRSQIVQVTKILETQNVIMAGQSKILETDSTILKDIHDAVEKLEKMRQLDKMRGAP